MMRGGGGALGLRSASSSSRSYLTEDEEFGSVYDHRVIMRMAPFVLPFKGLVVGAFLAMVAFTASQVAVPWIIKVAVDDYVIAGDYRGLTWVAAIFFGNAILNWGSLFAMELLIGRAGQGVLHNVRGAMFSHLQKLSLTFYNKTEVGRIMSRVQGDVYQLQEFLGVAVITLGDVLSLVGYTAALLLLSVKLGLISLAVIPVLVIAVVVWEPFAKRAFVAVRGTISIVNGTFNENITGVRVVQSMNREDRNLGEFDDVNRANYKSTLKAAKLSAVLLPPVDMLTAAAIALVLIFGAGMVSEGALEVGAMLAFVLYIQRLFEPIRSLTMQYTQLQRAMASGTRIFELLDSKPDLMDASDAAEMPPMKGEVELRNVSFGYSADEDVIHDVSLHVNPGETVAIVGPTGAGKTTLVSLMSRFYDVPRDRGAILVDGHDIRDVTRHSLASQMSMVLQEPFLFSGTILDNIKYNRTDAREKDIVRAAKAVGAHDFIMKQSDAYDTYLQERGVNLSLGQRQLISFARAIVADPRILILDEATANIDSYTEMLIQKALQELLKGRTSVVIAHRLSTIRGADKIVVLNGGCIEEVGKHAELMDSDGLYAHLYKMNYAALEAAFVHGEDEPEL